VRILIVDDHALVVEGLCNLLASRGFEVVGTAGDGQEGVERALRLEPDLVLMDIRMPRCDGLAATRLIKAQRPGMKIVMLTTSAEDDDLFEAIKSGACGYLLKSTRGAEFIQALHGLEEGTPPFSPGLAARLLREFADLSERGEEEGRTRGEGDEETRRRGGAPRDPLPGSERGGGPGHEPAGASRLSERQAEVLRLVASGLTYKQVAAKLNLSDHTVRYHMSEIMQILHLENRSQVIAFAGKLSSK
jgi:DNA-binding NarL/FixJ family response regulator